MSFLPFIKKKEVPDELPSLIADEIKESGYAPPISQNQKSQVEIVKNYLNQEEQKISSISLNSNSRISYEKPKEDSSVLVSKSNEDDEKSFFKELQKNINKEISDLNGLENWYNNKFLPRDVVSEMRAYWEKQKNNTVVQIIGKNFQERIIQKTIKLKELEKEWQDIYFDLIEKEEEIRAHEQELKKILSEFVELCNRRQREEREEKRKRL